MFSAQLKSTIKTRNSRTIITLSPSLTLWLTFIYNITHALMPGRIAILQLHAAQIGERKKTKQKKKRKKKKKKKKRRKKDRKRKMERAVLRFKTRPFSMRLTKCSGVIRARQFSMTVRVTADVSHALGKNPAREERRAGAGAGAGAGYATDGIVARDSPRG